MKVKYLLGIAVIFMAISCGSNQTEENAQNADSSQSKTDSNSSAKDTINTISDQDAAFAKVAANIGMMEIALGKVAEQNSSRKDVKDFGAMMIKDHTTAADELQRIAEARRITLPVALSSEDQSKVDAMKAKTGKNFDKSYLDMMVDGHKKAAEEFQNEINKGSNADLRGFATKTLDVIHAHLDAAQKCQQMGKGN
jgi:putative membrane protein